MNSTSIWPLFFLNEFPVTGKLDQTFKLCEGCDYGNKPIDMPFQSRNVVEFSSSYVARSVSSKTFLQGIIIYLYLVFEIVQILMF